VRELRDSGVTVVITTHDMDEAAALADRVGIMDHGRLLALDTPAALTRSLPGSATLDVDVERAPGDSDEAVLAALAALPQAERVEPVADAAGPAGAAVPPPPTPRAPSGRCQRCSPPAAPGSPACGSASRASRTSSSA
jgi:energy-coupling factor transporter ATP-binding protein EcfA2